MGVRSRVLHSAVLQQGFHNVSGHFYRRLGCSMMPTMCDKYNSA
jgi:hypothetical protein